MEKTVFTDVYILDGTGRMPFVGEVALKGNRIEAVGEGRISVSRSGATLVDGTGAYLMPGLVESHVHLGLDNSNDIIALGALPPEEHTLLAMRNAKLYLDHGFTSCISAGAVKPRLDIVIRNAINAGHIPGPRLLASTPWLTVTGGLVDMNLLHMKREAIAIVLDGPDAYRRTVRELIREGVDVVKLVVSGDTGIPYADSRHTVMTEAEVAAAAEETLSRERRFNVHARSAESVKRAVRHGASIVYHATFADDEALDLLETHRDRLFVSPNIGYTAALVTATGADLPDRAQQHAIFQGELEASRRSLKALRKRGIRLLGGGDYGFEATPHGGNARDIEHFVTLFGFTPMEAILTMTRNGGEAMGTDIPLGQIKKGYLADLLLVDGNPLEDVRLLQDPAHLIAIMKDGKFHKAPSVAAKTTTKDRTKPFAQKKSA
ncbi:MAG: amidohydrolase family protein [candidate division Zixibacteria bacterium]|nr:amidohydrolase family protein [candidate division Zixibacteria bacterium]